MTTSTLEEGSVKLLLSQQMGLSVHNIGQRARERAEYRKVEIQQDFNKYVKNCMAHAPPENTFMMKMSALDRTKGDLRAERRRQEKTKAAQAGRGVPAGGGVAPPAPPSK